MPSTNGISWSNFRGTCVPFRGLFLHADQTGSLTPPQVFPQLKSAGINAVRLDGPNWGMKEKIDALYGAGTYISGSPPSPYVSVKECLDEAQSNGIQVMIGEMAQRAADPSNWPLDLQTWQGAQITSAQMSANFVNNIDYWGTGQPWSSKYQGIKIWDAIIRGYVNPLVSFCEGYSAVIAYDIQNEPKEFGGTASGYQSMYNYFGSAIRAISKSKYIGFEEESGQFGNTGGPSAVFPSQVAQPLVYVCHYPTLAEIPSIASDCNALGIPFIDGEDSESNFTNQGESQMLSALSQANSFGFVFRWDCGSMLTSLPSGCGISSATQTWINTADSVLGPAQFFTAGTPPPTIFLSPASLTAGSGYTISGTNFAANSLLSISINGSAFSSLGTSANSNGSFVVSETAPSTAGSYNISIKDALGNQASATLTVTAPTATSTSVTVSAHSA